MIDPSHVKQIAKGFKIRSMNSQDVFQEAYVLALECPRGEDVDRHIYNGLRRVHHAAMNRDGYELAEAKEGEERRWQKMKATHDPELFHDTFKDAEAFELLRPFFTPQQFDIYTQLRTGRTTEEIAEVVDTSPGNVRFSKVKIEQRLQQLRALCDRVVSVSANAQS